MRRLFVTAAGVVLIVLGLAGYHVEIGSLLIGLVLVGAVSGDWLVELVELHEHDDDRDD